MRDFVHQCYLQIDRDNFQFRAKSGIKRSFQSLISIYQKCLKRSVPDSIIRVGIGWRQISAFRPLGRDCTRLRDRKMSWIVSKGRAAFSYHTLNISQITRTLKIQRSLCYDFLKFHDFWTLRTYRARMRGHRIF